MCSYLYRKRGRKIDWNMKNYITNTDINAEEICFFNTLMVIREVSHHHFVCGVMCVHSLVIADCV